MFYVYEIKKGNGWTDIFVSDTVIDGATVLYKSDSYQACDSFVQWNIET